MKRARGRALLAKGDVDAAFQDLEQVSQAAIGLRDRILLAAFGAGLTRAAGMLRWGKRTTPLGTSDAALPPCDQTALELLDEAIRKTR